MKLPSLRLVRRGPSAVDGKAFARLARGEIGALGEIYDRHHDAVFRFVVRATAGAADAEDLVHAVFLTAAKHASTFDGRESCLPWLLGIAARLVQRRRRTLARYARMLLAFDRERAESRSYDPRDSLNARAELDDLERALAELSDRKRVVLVLAEIEGLSCEAIAELLGVPVGTVWTRLHHARRQLRERLARERKP